jgi:predicted esterase
MTELGLTLQTTLLFNSSYFWVGLINNGLINYNNFETNSLCDLYFIYIIHMKNDEICSTPHEIAMQPIYKASDTSMIVWFKKNILD